MLKLQMFLRQFDPLLLPSLVLGTIRNSDGSGTWPFFVDATKEWPKHKIIALLKENGISTWGWGSSIKNEWHFTVRRSQAVWAEYLMLRAKIPVRGRRLTTSEVEVRDNRTSHSSLPRDSGGSRFETESEIASDVRSQKGDSGSHSTLDPVELATSGVNRVVDWLAR